MLSLGMEFATFPWAKGICLATKAYLKEGAMETNWIQRRGVKDVLICSAFLILMAMFSFLLPVVVVPSFKPLAF